MSEGPKSIRVKAGSLELAALDYGNVGASPVVLLHGQADLAWSMHSVAVALASRFRVVSLDFRGHGDSPQPGAYSILHLVADLNGAIEALGLERPLLIAHSLGGHIAATWAGLFPGRAAGLVLIEGTGPPAHNAAATQEGHDQLARAYVALLGTPMAHKPMADIAEAAARLVRAHPRLAPERARFLAECGTTTGPDGGLVWKFDPRTREWISSVDHVATERRWRAVDAPVLVITGADSWDNWWNARRFGVAVAEGRQRLTEDEFAARLAAFVDHEHAVIEGAGHMVQFDQPDRLNEVILGFLSRRGFCAG